MLVWSSAASTAGGQVLVPLESKVRVETRIRATRADDNVQTQCRHQTSTTPCSFQWPGGLEGVDNKLGIRGVSCNSSLNPICLTRSNEVRVPNRTMLDGTELARSCLSSSWSNLNCVQVGIFASGAVASHRDKPTTARADSKLSPNPSHFCFFAFFFSPFASSLGAAAGF